jgi:hypothetical protein
MNFEFFFLEFHEAIFILNCCWCEFATRGNLVEQLSHVFKQLMKKIVNF